MSTTPGGGIASRVQDELAAGRTDAEILDGLAASGLSRKTAERFLEKARSAPPAPDAMSAEAFQPPPSMTDSYGRALAGASASALLIVAHLWFQHTGTVHVRPRSLGPLLVGFLWTAHHAFRYVGAAQPRPWRAVGWAVMLPLTVATGLFGYSEGYRPFRQNTAARKQAVAEMSAVDRQAADARRAAADATRLEQARADDARLLGLLENDRVPTMQCTAALDLGRTGRRAHVPVLYDVLRTARFDELKGCAAAGLVQLGEVGAMLGRYDDWARGSNDTLRRSALSGFGEIGPEAAALALPHLSVELQSPHASTRWVTVAILSKLGPDARPLLEQATSDVDNDVREHARTALAALPAESARR